MRSYLCGIGLLLLMSYNHVPKAINDSIAMDEQLLKELLLRARPLFLFPFPFPLPHTFFQRLT